ncbi:MAG: methylated-DNA--[protein]-cysteine S-methyltransferase [Lautropia sp.]
MPNGAVPNGYLFITTAIGVCGLAWHGERLVACQLPEAQLARTRRRLLVRLGVCVPSGSPVVATAVPESEWPPFVAAAAMRLVALLDGAVDDLADLPLAYDGIAEFDRRVYQVARAIPVGRTLTYGEVAAWLGMPGAARAVGAALGRNPFAPIVPCHRVLAAGARSGGFSAEGGVATKLRLLQIERARCGSEPELFEAPAASLTG